MKKVTTLTEFVLQEERKVPEATGTLTLLLAHLQDAGKIIASHVKNSGLVDILGSTGKTNSSMDEVQKLDSFSNDLLTELLTSTGQVCTIASEELEEPVHVKNCTGDYVICFDPIDGSSNIDTNISVGTIFSIFKKTNTMMQPGTKQVAAGYILYGSSVMFVYTCGNGVNGFTLDPAVGSFLLSHPQMRIPEEKKEYSFNEGKYYLLNESNREYLETIKKEFYQLRYVGSMVADIHRILIKGGIFLHPADEKMKNGKLRLMFEVNPMSWLIQQAGGLAVSGIQNPLEIIPTQIHQRVPIVLGSKKEVEKYLTLIQ